MFVEVIVRPKWRAAQASASTYSLYLSPPTPSDSPSHAHVRAMWTADGSCITTAPQTGPTPSSSRHAYTRLHSRRLEQVDKVEERRTTQEGLAEGPVIVAQAEVDADDAGSAEEPADALRRQRPLSPTRFSDDGDASSETRRTALPPGKVTVMFESALAHGSGRRASATLSESGREAGRDLQA